MHAMILCAGLGTRLRPLTDERPKPLVPVLDRPLASYALDALARVGVRHVVANAHHLAEQVEPALRPFTDARGMSLTVLTERTLLGTGGGIRNALPHLGAGPFIVFNGDVLARPDLARALKVHADRRARMTLLLRDDPRARKLGAIEVTGDHRVVRILSEGPEPAEPTRACVFSGIYVVDPGVADDLPTEGCVVRHTLRRLMARGEPVAGVIDDGPWFDLGTPETYADAQFAMLDGRLQGFDTPRIDGGAHVGDGAVVAEGVTLGPGVCLGRGAKVIGEGQISRAIVWDGATAVAPTSGVVVSPRSVVRL